ncbi:uncharacterized protein HMPREF1541_09003 [Cyphellophora europaea CBS 101466]|uniref:Uncharacterized protein n=1 Tax=Cyphellophora europaea (strain CBS 101466) TaxID=1220924 RepID=W2RK56_CYPE1|nr:uncharacterized protein HMPREF1541_09003 [Cyphellophora europaea CBS 101466]ETN36725.1 hypothetical protein HMPREF1541_09003 [Cyphellophora europaea CBS 101466]
MPNNSLLPSALNPTCEELETSDDGLDDNRPALTKIWSLVANQLAEEHRTLQDQQQLLISRWDSMRDLLVDEENRIQVYAHRLEVKGTEPRPLFRSLTEQASNREEHRLAKNPSSFPEEQRIASTARTEGQKAQDSSLRQKAAEEQDRKLHNLEQANECLRNQLTSLNNKLGAVTKELATARERCASSECCVHLIQDLEDRRARADEVILLVHDRLESLQKRHQKAEKDMSRLRHQGRNKDLTHKQQLSLRKTEYCELERCLDEITDERDKLRGQLNRVLTESATRLTRIRVLESEHSELVSERRERPHPVIQDCRRGAETRDHNRDSGQDPTTSKHVSETPTIWRRPSHTGGHARETM